jgi:hypothetical protein
MKKILVVLCSIMLQFSVSAQDGTAEQKAFMDYATPGPMHAMLAKRNGNWTQQISFWMKPGAEPMKWTSTAVNEMIMDGRYQRTTATGSFMGMAFSGMSITGYDNAKKIFFTTWMDNMGTGIMYGEGDWNDAKKCIVFKGKSILDPQVKKEVPYRTVITFIDDNHQKMEMFVTDKAGKEFKSMEMLSTRA